MVRSPALTDGEVGEELVLERAEELVVAGVRLEVHFPQVGRAVDGHLDELGGLVCLAGSRDVGERVLAVRPHRRPPHHPRPAHQNTGGSKEPTSNSTPPQRPKQLPLCYFGIFLKKKKRKGLCSSAGEGGAYLGAGAASEEAASGEERSGLASEEARLRSASGKAEDEDEDKEAATAAGAGAEPGRRRVSVSAVSSKSSPEAAEDSVELRSVSTDMAGGGVLGSALGGFLFFVRASEGGRTAGGGGRGRKRKRQRRQLGERWFGYSGWAAVTPSSGRDSFRV